MPLVPLKQPTRNPRFNPWRGAATVTTTPPFDFSGVVMRFFPLKADFLALSRFCDRYLNVAPDFAYFRPSMPFVLLCIVNYGRMSRERGNLGWTSQNEVFFSVPLEWYERENGEHVFVDQAQVAPFIFVDDESSQVAGREVYGWPKVQGWFAGGIDRWAVEPRSPRRLLALRTRVFERLYAGEAPEPRNLLAIEEEPPPSVSVVPPERDNPLNPAVGIPNAMFAWSELARDALEMWMALPTRGYEAIDRRTLPNLAASAMRSMDVFNGRFHANTINLKQFRDAASPSRVCYQALTNARLETTQFRRGGMLGDPALLRGDPSGGFRILLSRYESMPIVETLGLEVSSETLGEDSPIATLTPVFPFWQEVDLRYQTGHVLCWRTRDLDWRNATHESTRPESEPHVYNTTCSTGVHVATGPFRFRKVTLRILPLEADPRKLREICDAALNEGLERDGVRRRAGRIRAVGSYVYLVVVSFGEMSSDTNDIGPWADRRVDFAIPVRWEGAAQRRERLEKREKEIAHWLGGELLEGVQKRKLEEELVEVRGLREKLEKEGESAADDYEAKRRTRGKQVAFLDEYMDGFFSPFMYAQSGIATSTGREVNGWNLIESNIASPESPWLADVFDPPMPLLHLSTEVTPAFGVGQKSRWRVVLEVLEEVTPRGEQEGSPPAELKGPYERMMEILRGEYELADRGAALTQFSLKQFRDAAEPARACYQAIVRCPTVVERIHEHRAIEKRIQVKIHRYASQDIVDALGLAVQSHEGSVACLKPAYGFFVKADLRADLAENLCWRAGSEDWKQPLDGKRRGARG